jgi:CubicO group peptidase (beta-lactamase class C family)
MTIRGRRGLAGRCLALVTVLSAGAVNAQRVDDGAVARAEAAIADAFTSSGAPGAAVVAVVGEEVVWARGYGVANTETGAPVTPDTLFQIGSVTKSFTAAALLSASAQGLVALDRPVSTYVPGLNACVGAPTLTQLLSHTGGLMDEPDEFGPQGEEGLAAYARTWTSEYCLLPPGRAFSYSNSGFALAGLAVQEAERKPFADVMRARVLDPLGMARTTFRPTEAMTWPLAVGHRRDNEGRLTVVRPLANDARLWPAGTMYSSANEMARFAQALLGDGRVPGAPGLPAGVVGRMRAELAEIPTTAQRYGLGLFHTAGKFGHGGTMTGSVAQLDVDPAANLAVVVLTNGDNANPTAMAEAARTLGLASQNKVESRHLDGTKSAPVTTLGEVAPYVGTYRNPRRFTVEVVRQGEGLVLKRFGRDFPMRYASPGRFLVDLPRGGTETIAFGIGPDGRADYLQMNVWALARVK